MHPLSVILLPTMYDEFVPTRLRRVLCKRLMRQQNFVRPPTSAAASAAEASCSSGTANAGFRPVDCSRGPTWAGSGMSHAARAGLGQPRQRTGLAEQPALAECAAQLFHQPGQLVGLDRLGNGLGAYRPRQVEHRGDDFALALAAQGAL